MNTQRHSSSCYNHWNQPGKCHRLFHNFIILVALALALLAVGCDQRNATARTSSQAQVILAEDLSAPPLPTINYDKSVDSPIISERSKSSQGFFRILSSSSLEVQARTRPTSESTDVSDSESSSQEHLSTSSRNKDPMAPIVVSHGWEAQLNEETPRILGQQKKSRPFVPRNY